MIEDLRQFETGKTLSVDVCLVGAGAAGITIAKKLIGSGLRVCVVEAGGINDEPDTQALYQGESVGHLVTLDEGRYRVFGGSTTRWSGRCATLDPIDFQVRDWIPKSGWPIALESLLPYYIQAQSMSGFQKSWASDETIIKSLGIELPKFESEYVRPYIWHFALEGYHVNFCWSAAYRHELDADPNTHVLLHANLVAFEGNADGSNIEAVNVSSLTNVSMTIRAKAFVLCCGGIENARLLLNAPENIQRRVNEFDNVGRYFAQHPRGCIATLKTTPQTAQRLQNLFTVFWRRRRSNPTYEIGFALSEQAQREHGLVNASAAIYYAARSDSYWNSIDRLREAFRSRTSYKGIFGDIVNALNNARSVGANFVRRAFLDLPAILPDPLVSIVADLEQAPNPDSRVTLSDERDPLGMKRAKVDWRISEIERTTARYFNSFISDELKHLGLGQTDASAWLNGEVPVDGDELYGTYHHIGTTRMSLDPRDGVVNSDCRAHGVENLYLMGCSVFPTGGHANPTLTIVALAIRLADHIRARLGASQSPADAT